MGILLMKILIAEYAVLALAFLVKGDFPRAGYFLSAIGISLSVLWMK